MFQMKENKKMTAIILIIVFMLSFANPVAVFADDATPTEPTPQVEQTQEPTDDVTSGPPDENPAPFTPPEEAQPLAEVLEDIPEDTNIIVVAEDGQVEPLASQAAADAIQEIDPMWCPDGASDGSDCYNALSITDLFSGMPPQSGGGTLYFMTAYNGDDLNFDHDAPHLANLTNLTIQGGWDGVTTGTPSFSGSTILTHMLSFSNWTGNLIINNMDVQVGNPFYYGIMVYNHTGNVTINESSGTNSGYGLYLETVTGDVSIQNSEFSDNFNKGFEANSIDGSVTITNSSFDRNGGQGTFLSDLRDVTITNSTFNENLWEGLIIQSGQDIILDNVQANGNNFDQSWENGIRHVDSVNISRSQFSGNSQNGLILEDVAGTISINNSLFHSNDGWGLVFYDDQGEITVMCSFFKNNQEGEFLLSGETPEGAVTLIGCKETSPKSNQSEGIIVLVNGGEKVPLECGNAWTLLVLPSGDRARYAGFCGGDVQLIPVGQNELPGMLPDGSAYASSFTAVTLQNGVVQQILPAGGTANLSFLIPAGLEGKDLAMLFWDAGVGKWVEIPRLGDEDAFSASNDGMRAVKGLSISDGGFASATVNFSGTFVLVTR